MRKFPVISELGNEYEVKIYFGDRIYDAGLNVVISEKRKGIFGRQRNVVLSHYNQLKFEKDVLKEYTYVELVKKYVKIFEDENLAAINFKKRKRNIEKEFYEWDGFC